MARSLDQLALYVDRQGRWAEADSLYREALAMRRRLLGDEHPDVAATMNNLATVRYRRGDWAGGRDAGRGRGPLAPDVGHRPPELRHRPEQPRRAEAALADLASGGA